MLKGVSFERAEFLLVRQVTEGHISDWSPAEMYGLAERIRTHAKRTLCIANRFDQLERGQVDRVKKTIEQCDVTPAGEVFILETPPPEGWL